MHVRNGAKTLAVLAALAWAFGAGNAHAQDVRVENVESRREGETVTITYDLRGERGETRRVTFLVSVEGKNYRPEAVSGDVGSGIKPGPDKRIRWTIREDFPQGLQRFAGQQVSYRVVAEQPQRGSGAAWRSAVFPGWGQLRKDQNGKALAFGIAGIATLATVGWTLIRDRTDYQDFRDAFWTGASRRARLRQSRFAAAKIAKNLRVRYNRARLNVWLRNAAVAAFAGIWAWSLYDSAQGSFQPVNQSIYVGESLYIEHPRVGVSPIDGKPTVQLSLSVRL